MLVVTPTIVDRLVRIEAENLRSRLQHYVDGDANPCGVHMKRFGDATAFIALDIPTRFFNSVLAVSLETAKHLDAIKAFYAEHGRKPIFEIAPGRFDEAFGEALAERGYRMVEFHTGLARELTPDDRHREAPDVERVDPFDAAAFDAWIDVFNEGWSGPGDHSGAKSNMRKWKANDAWQFFLARVDGSPAGAAILDVQGPTAMMGSASTPEAFRGRGLQRQLLDRRIAAAAEAGCDLVVGGSYFDNVSMRNQQRAGLYTAFTRGIWTHRDDPAPPPSH
ncbi:MAG: GNAT family N-acetyltransferase [Deltaproteobacteria bacterium]